MYTKSLTCSLCNGEKDKIRAIEEAEQYAIYEDLGKKEMLHMRLITEELLGMVHNLVDVKYGEFRIVNTGKGYEYHLNFEADVIEDVRKIFVSASKDGVNRAYQGVTGLIRKAMDEMFDTMDPYTSAAIAQSTDYMTGTSYNNDLLYSGMVHEWSYNYYKEQLKKEDNAKKWDELELSILGKLADDIIVSVRPKRASITIITTKK